jgi:2-dehydropantoate 2-reductase
VEAVLQSSPSKNHFKVLVFGAGAIGTYMGGSLTLAGHDVVFVERPKNVIELRSHGLQLDLSIDPRRNTQAVYRVEPRSFVAAESLVGALNHGPFDVALFALKSFDTAAALEGMKPLADKLPPVLCLSNGVENENMIATILGWNRVIYGTVTTAVGRRGPGQITLEKLRGVGVAAGHPLSEKLTTAFNDAYLKCIPYPEPHSMKWSKMLTNLVANPTSAILDMAPKQIFANAGLYELEIDMVRECVNVMKAKELKVVDPPSTPGRALAAATKLPLWLSRPLFSRVAARGRGGKMPSFHIDLYSGREKSEVEYLHGAVVRAGRECGVPTPVNQFLTETLLALTRREMPLEEYAHQPEKLLRALDRYRQNVH